MMCNFSGASQKFFQIIILRNSDVIEMKYGNTSIYHFGNSLNVSTHKCDAD